MRRASKWHARGYWLLAAILIPLANPVLLVLGVAAAGADESWLAVAVAVAVADGLILWLVSSRVWAAGDGRHWRLALGLVVAVALSFAAGFAELVVYLDAACPDEGCFN